MRGQKGDGQTKNGAVKIPLTGPEQSVCLRLEKQNSVSVSCISCCREISVAEEA